MPFVYRPMLRTKAGEATALQHLSAVAQQRIFPIFHVVSEPTANIATQIAQAWSGREMALDGHFNHSVTGSPNDLVSLMNDLRANGVPVIPSIRVGAPAPLLQAVQQYLVQHGARVVVQCGLTTLSNAQAWVAAQGWAHGDADLVVTAGHVPDVDLALLEGLVIQNMSAHVTNPATWRSVTLASSSAPRDMGPLNRGRNNVPRLDWRLWQDVNQQLPFAPDYGDYGISHPEMAEPPGYVMPRATVSVRYTSHDDWIIYKGVPTTGRSGQPMRQQYRAHAQALVALPEFGGVAGCWGDTRIQAIATSTGPAGNRAQWVGFSVNRHLSIVANDLP